MNAIAMQTSALDAEGDMFDAPVWFGVDLASAPSSHGERLAIVGVLASRAVVRTQLARDGITPSPVLCLELMHVGPGNHHVYAEQIYPVNGRKAAEDKAASMPKGTRVTVVSSLADMRLTLPHVESITSIASS